LTRKSIIQDYNGGNIGPVEFCRRLILYSREQADIEAKKKRRTPEYLVHRATEALLELTDAASPNQMISKNTIRARAGIDKKQSGTAGLWYYLPGRASQIIEVKPTGARIRPEFIEPLRKALGLI
jgi:hypothetical protein